jgi:hypothetical protein
MLRIVFSRIEFANVERIERSFELQPAARIRSRAAFR